MIMKGKKKNFKDIVSNNKGLTFVEIVISIVLLVIVIGPLMKSVIAAQRVNLESRKTMSATDAGQAVLESMCGKSYRGLLTSYNGSALSNGSELARFLDGASSDIYNNNVKLSYNDPGNYFAVSCPNLTQINAGPVGTASTEDLASGNAEAFSFALLNYYGTAALDYAMTSPNDQNLVLYADCPGDRNSEGKVMHLADAKCLFFAYTNVDWNGYKFDIIGYVIPAVQNVPANQALAFYPCKIRVAVFDATGGNHTCRSESPLLVLDSGIRNR